MNRLIFFTCLLSIASGCKKSDLPAANSQESAWNLVETPTTNDMVDLYFTSNDFGVACGSFGTFLRTEDAGETWQSLDVGVGYSFTNVFALNEDELFTARVGLYKSNDSGVSFEEIGDVGSLGSSISDIHFFDTQNGLIVKGSTVYLSNDDGNNWTPIYPFEGYASILEATDDSTVYLAGGNTFDSVSQGELHKSTDHGETWEMIDLPEDIGSSQITAIDFLNNETGYVSTLENNLFKTIDGGENWTLVDELGFGPISDLLFVNENDGYLIGQDRVYETRNGGLEWHADYQTESNEHLTSIAVAPNGTVYVSGLGGIMLKRQ